MRGAYHMPDCPGPVAAADDPRVARLRRAGRWAFAQHPASGCVAYPAEDERFDPAAHGEPETLADGLVWLPPRVAPSLHDLARASMPQPATTVELRRQGRVSIPLGVGPVYGCGPRRGEPSSEFGELVLAVDQRLSETGEHPPEDLDEDLRRWTAADEARLERLCFLALQAGYELTEELFARIAPYDADEIAVIWEGILGIDPKAAAGATATAPPSPPA